MTDIPEHMRAALDALGVRIPAPPRPVYPPAWKPTPEQPECPF